MLRILALGDIVGRPGRQVVAEKLPGLVKQHNVDLVIANGENIAGGSGITQNLFNKLRAYGVDVVTLGDHVFKKLDIVDTMARSERIVRCANLSRLAAGRGHTVVRTNAKNIPVAVFAVMGRVYVPTMAVDDPFAAADRVLQDVKDMAKVIVCDIHAEATGEKVALGHHMDGRASFIFGTHTHIPTADAKILPGGTAYITDLGMCGPYDSVLGRRKDNVVRAMTTNMPYPYDVATGDVRLCGALVDIDETTGKATAIERIEVQGANVSPAYDADDHAKGGKA
ncbi:MAG: TIGR00282 family metallophosphoesterase [Tepidisphaeraceae bacterium]